MPLRDINISKAIIIWIFKRMIVVIIEIIVFETKPNSVKITLMLSVLYDRIYLHNYKIILTFIREAIRNLHNTSIKKLSFPILRQK